MSRPGDGGEADQGWRARARRLKLQTYTLYRAYRDPRTPWYAKLFAALVVGYAFSPIDLIPDFIPVLGYVDDLILVPLGVALALRMIPAEVLKAARQDARELVAAGKPVSRVAAVVVVAIWLLALAAVVVLVVRVVGSAHM
jgi:uncharacterized membrane protein YkvA (DUF1232 family)